MSNDPQAPLRQTDGPLTDPDPYEAIMQGDDKVLHRQKMTWPWYFQLLFLLPGLLGIASLIGAGAPLLPFLMLIAAMTFFWMMFYALRVTVTPERVAIQYGLIGPRIRVDDIVHCEAEKYPFWRYGGYGLRYSVIDGSWAFNVLGDKGKAVRIHYKTRLGTTRKIVVSSAHPNVMADAINRARHAKGHDVPMISALSDADFGLGSADQERFALPDEPALVQEADARAEAVEAASIAKKSS